MKKLHPVRFMIILALVVGIVWTGLTIWVELPAREETTTLGHPNDSLQVLIVYDPDPIYNLDEQVCRALAKGLNETRIGAVLATPKAAAMLDLHSFHDIVVCANTYNWAPDKAVTDFIENSELAGKNVVAITVGSGSTTEARAKLERAIRSAGANILLSKEWWLMRPNDESRMEEENVDVAVDQAYHTGLIVSGSIRQSKSSN